MVDVVSVVMAVISLLGVIIAASITALVPMYMEKTKQVSEDKVVAKYRDPLLLSSKELEGRIFKIVDTNLLNYSNGRQRDFIIIYTAFLVGQYLSWTYILRWEVQFLRLSSDESNQKLTCLLDRIQNTLSTCRYEAQDPDEAQFLLWRGQQMAIGEIMTIYQDDQRVCMGYADFTEKFKDNDPTFRHWFTPITDSIEELLEPWSRGICPAAPRLRRLQHLLIDLMDHLDPDRLSSLENKIKRVKPAPNCDCTTCKAASEAAKAKPVLFGNYKTKDRGRNAERAPLLPTKGEPSRLILYR